MSTLVAVPLSTRLVAFFVAVVPVCILVSTAPGLKNVTGFFVTFIAPRV